MPGSAALGEIEEMVHRETRAWDARDAEALVELFHPDMVWPWPPTALSHDPIHWVIPQGRFHRERWKRGWQDLFDNYSLRHNRRVIRKIELSAEEDGGFAVVDIDTLWLDREDIQSHWNGRVCKVYTKIASGWKLIMHTGVLQY